MKELHKMGGKELIDFMQKNQQMAPQCIAEFERRNIRSNQLFMILQVILSALVTAATIALVVIEAGRSG